MTDGEIARRAYEKWIVRSRTWDHQPWDHQLQDWLEAEAELALTAAMNGQVTEARERLASLFAERRQAELRLRAEREVGNILSTGDSLEDAAPKLVQALCESLGWDVGAVWLLDQDANRLRCVGLWHQPDTDATDFERETRLRTYTPGIGLPGRVWASDSLVWITDVACEANFPRGPVAAREGLHRGIGFPVRNGAEFLGVLEFFSKDVLPPDDQLTEMMASVGGHISQFIGRRNAERRWIRQDHECRIARDIQRGLLPQAMPRLPGFEISGRSVALGEVGGDCFDFIPFPDGGRSGIGVLVADACGHGIGAALLAAQVQAYLRGLSSTGTDVAGILQITNQCLCENPFGQFITAFFARLDPGTRSLDYASAGHLPGYVLDAQGQTKAVLDSTGFPLGMMLANTFPPSPAVSLMPGDLVVLVTDGVTEAASPNGELFGMERTLCLVREHRRQAADDILTVLFDAVGDFCHKDHHDDLTAVVIKVDGDGQ